LKEERIAELWKWRQRLSPVLRNQAEVQRIIGYLELKNGNPSAAFAAFIAAARREPDRRDVCYQISQLLYQAGDNEAAAVFVQHLERLRRLQETQDRTLMGAAAPDVSSMLALISAYADCGRLLEAYGWSQLAAERFPDAPLLLERRQRLYEATRGLPLSLIPEDLNPAFRIAVSDYQFAVPDVVTDRNTEDPQQPGSDVAARFEVTGAAAGLDFTFQNGVADQATRRMFEFTGGGTAVVDVDLDGWEDIAFAQGGLWDMRGTPQNAADAIFRNVRGTRFAEISAASQFGGTEFAQGLAVGDLDQDGFPDVLVVGVGAATVWVNRGDGTFSRKEIPLPATLPPDHWLTSCAMGDFNQDGFSDLYLAGYLAGPDLFDRTCPGAGPDPELCSPTQFSAANDILLMNDGRGGFHDATQLLPNAGAGGKGLGVLVFDPAGSGRPAVFVTNDTTPNALLVPAEDGQSWSDTAFASGLAVSSQGKPEGSMGIAFGDVDGDGHWDVLTTNFLFEGHAFHHGQGNAVFRDERSQTEILNASRDVLGFGTQFLDVDLDGRVELFVANGHVDDLRHRDRPYRMQPQLFEFRDQRFHLLSAARLGSYFQERHLGRAVARLDWNADGLPDLAVTHLHEPSILLTNGCPQPGHHLGLRLIGTSGDRDAVCATLECTTGQTVQLRQITQGDGYLCANSKRVGFGCGAAKVVDKLRITWPGGGQQAFENVPVPGEYWLVQQRTQLYPVAAQSQP
jgi:hypothetical protein